MSLAASLLATDWFSRTSNELGLVITGTVLRAPVVLVTDWLLSARALFPTASWIGLVPGL